MKKIQFNNKAKISLREAFEDVSVTADDNRHIHGHAAPIGRMSRLQWTGDGAFYFVFEPEAFKDVIQNNDIHLYINHDPNQGCLARSKYGEGSLKVSITDYGMEFDTILGTNPLAEDIYQGMQRGDYDAISVGFYIDDYTVEPANDGNDIIRIKSCSGFDDISILSVLPAFRETEVHIVENESQDENLPSNEKNEENLTQSEKNFENNSPNPEENAIITKIEDQNDSTEDTNDSTDDQTDSKEDEVKLDDNKPDETDTDGDNPDDKDTDKTEESASMVKKLLDLDLL
jgi:hypothetical protein